MPEGWNKATWRLTPNITTHVVTQESLVTDDQDRTPHMILGKENGGKFFFRLLFFFLRKKKKKKKALLCPTTWIPVLCVQKHTSNRAASLPDAFSFHRDKWDDSTSFTLRIRCSVSQTKPSVCCSTHTRHCLPPVKAFCRHTHHHLTHFWKRTSVVKVKTVFFA